MFERVRQATPEPERAQEPARVAGGKVTAARQRGDERRAVLAVAQAKLTVGAVADPYEREADRVADRVMEIVQRMDGNKAPSADDVVHRRVDTTVRRHVGHRDAEVGAEGGELSEELTTRIRRSSGSGAPLPVDVRGPMESAFGTDFADVRVHTNSEIAPRIAATAFTMGRDIHFAPGAYRPADRSGMWLLGHELTHVVQQTGATPLADNDLDVHRRFGSCINRHASKEHYMLGSMTPAQIRSIADAKENVEVTAGKGVVKAFKNLVSGPDRPPPAALAEALQSVQEQLTGLDKWRTVTGPGDPDPATIVKGNTVYDHTWGGQLVTVPCRDGELVCTVGELNALPDFFGSYDDLRVVDRSVAFKTFQVIRRETYIYLKQLEAQLQGRKYSYNTKTEAFTGIEKNNISLPNAALPKFGDDIADVMESAKMTKGTNGETGVDESIAADATLGRNACHFPPESWLRWREHHMRARALIAGSTTLPQLAQNANEAIGVNAFGEHYLQDSFAGGHLINKGFVMAVAMEHASYATKKLRGMDDGRIAELQQATAHSAAYGVPDAAKGKLDARPGGRRVGANAFDDPTIKARDPQSALEAAKQAGGSAAAGRRNEMAASGIDPNSMSFEQYRTWLNDLWLQKITNTLHDKYCLKGLDVASPDNPTIFKIYGDSNMMRSGAGAEYTAATSEMSRKAINLLVQNKRNELTPVVRGGKPRIPPKPVPRIEAIMARFPNTVKDDDGTVMSLQNWATGTPMRKKIAAIVSALSAEGWKEGKLTAVVKGLSVAKTVSPGLSAAHGPF